MPLHNVGHVPSKTWVMSPPKASLVAYRSLLSARAESLLALSLYSL